MHYCTLLITDEFPTENNISNIMEKYDCENLKSDEETGELIGEYPLFTWDYYQIGGRYAGSLKLKIDKDDEKYRWGYYAKDARNGRLFHSYLLYEMKKFSGNSFMYSEEKYFSSMGSQDGYLYVDSAFSDDLLNLDNQDCYICIDSDGTAIAREHWNGKDFIKDEDFDKKFKNMIDNCGGKYITILDIHD